MAPRTLASTWKQFAKAVERYARAPRSTRQKDAGVLSELVRKTNESPLVEALATLFVHPYSGMEQARVRFVEAEEGGFPEWAALFHSDDNTILLNPVGVFRFHDECRAAAGTLATPEARESFSRYRYQAYLSELRKLPGQYILFLLVLQEVANARQVSRVEKKGGEIELAEDERYLNLLWAFKELEAFFLRTNGLNLRGEYAVLWYESDWIVGR